MILNKFDKNKIFSRRLFFVIILKLVFIFVLISRLTYLQILKYTKYATLSDSNRIKSFILPPLRGKIYDRNNVIIATNSSYHRILLNPSKKINISKTLKKLSDILGIPRNKLLYYSKKSTHKSSDGYILIYDNITWHDIAKIEVNSPDLPGIYIETAQRRFYPYEKVTAHMIGYVASVNENEVKHSNNALLTHPDFKIGKNGIEKHFEDHLRGKAGFKHIEVDAYGYTIRNVDLNSSKASINGEKLTLSIDLEIQKYAYNLIKDVQAQISLIDIKTGEILALVSAPSYESNNFVSGISSEDWDSLLNNSGKPMINKAISTQYPPGSTFKPIVALAALENGLDPTKKIRCRGEMRLGRRKFHCWKKHGHGELDLVSAIEQSCNIYFYNLSREVGIKKIVETAREFGLGDYTDIILPNEKKGFLPTKEWKKKYFGEPWVLGDTFNSSIGQGFVETTGLQLAIFMARMASAEGKKITPSLLKIDNHEENQQFGELPFARDNINLILRGLYRVVNKRSGTAYYRRIKDKKYIMAGKTGTSQVVAINHNKKDKEEVDFEKRNHGLFVGYAPFMDPKYAISVVVEHGGSGSSSAAPIAKKILYKIQKMYDKKSV